MKRKVKKGGGAKQRISHKQETVQSGCIHIDRVFEFRGGRPFFGRNEKSSSDNFSRTGNRSEGPDSKHLLPACPHPR